MSGVKETEFFTKDYHNGPGFYEKYFSRAGNAVAIGEATPSYSFLPFAADRIKATIPEVKLIFCFRNPVERAYSHWLMLYNEGVEKACFSEAININAEQLRDINFEGDNGAEIWNKTAAHRKKEKGWIRPYLHPGMYAGSLSIYRQKFCNSQIKVIFAEDLKNNFDETMKNLFSFLEVDNNFIVRRREIQNASGSKHIYRMLKDILGFDAAGFISKITPTSVKKIFRSGQGYQPHIRREDALLLSQIYKEDINALAEFTKRDLSHWLVK